MMKSFFNSLFSVQRAAFIIFVSAFTAGAALAQGNIDATNKYAWSENAGWVNFAPTNGGVTVVLPGAYNRYLSGYAWAENIGWLLLGNTNGGPYQNTASNNWGVNIVSGVSLDGYAWSENCGWVHFSPANSQITINPSDGCFNGYAWTENIGWIHFKYAAPAYNVQTTTRLPSVTVYSGH